MVNTKILCEIVLKAGDLIMEIYESNDFQIDLKNDSSPVTKADRLANDYIIRELQKKYSDIPVVSEESKIPDYDIRKEWGECFIVDPLDGTKEFIAKNGEFTVNIAYIKDGKVVEGVIYAPAKKDLYYTKNSRSYKNGKLISCTKNNEKFTLLTSRSHPSSETEKFIETMREKHSNLSIESVGSSLKLCLIAEGRADLYPRFGATNEWDIAAGQAIVEQAGGRVLSVDKAQDLVYNKPSLISPFFIAYSHY